MLKLTWPQVLAFRLQRHHLEERAARDNLVAVVSRTCGLHAQVMSSTELAARARIEGLDSGAVSVALWKERTLGAQDRSCPTSVPASPRCAVAPCLHR
jgi:hypothetical protein